MFIVGPPSASARYKFPLLPAANQLSGLDRFSAAAMTQLVIQPWVTHNSKTQNHSLDTWVARGCRLAFANRKDAVSTICRPGFTLTFCALDVSQGFAAWSLLDVEPHLPRVVTYSESALFRRADYALINAEVLDSDILDEMLVIVPFDRRVGNACRYGMHIQT